MHQKKYDNGDGRGNVFIDRVIVASLLVYTMVFQFFRTFELLALVANYGMQCTSALIGTIAVGRAFGNRGRYLLYFVSMMALIYTIDRYLPAPLPPTTDEMVHSSKTVVITGANAGVGFETARQLAVHYGMQVILGCRSEIKCNKAARSINKEIDSLTTISNNGSARPLLVDLSDLQSVKEFASQLQHQKVDILLNNAGYIPAKGIPVNKYGLDPSFTSMHLAHFYLTEELIQYNPKLRVVNTASGTHHFCALPIAYAAPEFVLNALDWLYPRDMQSMLLPLKQNPGCIDEDYLDNGIKLETDGSAYLKAKLANVMHAVEIPRRHPGITSIAVDLGFVQSSIFSWMNGSLAPANFGLMRPTKAGVAPMIQAILMRDEELIGEADMKRKSAGILMNVFGRPVEAFSYSWWKDSAYGDFSAERMTELSAKLWEKSTELLNVNGF